jgi:hypothetical protein
MLVATLDKAKAYSELPKAAFFKALLLSSQVFVKSSKFLFNLIYAIAT